MDDGANTASSGGMKMRRLEESSTVLRCDAFGLVHLLHFCGGGFVLPSSSA